MVVVAGRVAQVAQVRTWSDCGQSPSKPPTHLPTNTNKYNKVEQKIILSSCLGTKPIGRFCWTCIPVQSYATGLITQCNARTGVVINK